MNLHQEHHFEREICAHLVANGWLHAEGDAAQFDRASGPSSRPTSPRSSRR
jgi:type I restriction enzyme R subunit